MRSEDERGERPLRRGAKRENRQRKMEGSQATRAMRAMRAMRASRGTDRESSLNKHPIYFFFSFSYEYFGEIGQLRNFPRKKHVHMEKGKLYARACVRVYCMCMFVLCVVCVNFVFTHACLRMCAYA